MVRVVKAPKARPKRKSKSKSKSKHKKPKPRRKHMAKTPKVENPESTEQAPAQLPDPPVDPPANPPVFRPEPIHIRRTFDAPWENIPIVTGDQNQTYFAVIFDNDMMLTFRGWQIYGDACPACGKTKHKD